MWLKHVIEGKIQENIKEKWNLYVSRYWKILTEREYTVNSNKKIYTALWGEVALVQSTDLSQDKLRTST